VRLPVLNRLPGRPLMAHQLQPTIDQWYAHRNQDELFRVVAVDEQADAIEIQSFDGDIEELDAQAWGELDIEAVEPPEDWTGPFDDLELDDVDDSEGAMRPGNLRAQPSPPAGQQESWRDGEPLGAGEVGDE
jgi:hypothetical protein